MKLKESIKNYLNKQVGSEVTELSEMEVVFSVLGGQALALLVCYFIFY